LRVVGRQEPAVEREMSRGITTLTIDGGHDINVGEALELVLTMTMTAAAAAGLGAQLGHKGLESALAVTSCF